MITDKLLYARKKMGIIKLLIIINVAMFLVVNITIGLVSISGGSGEDVIKSVALPANFIEAMSQPWTLITHMFLHLGFFHILGNMLLLYMMGRFLQMVVTDKQIIMFYIFGGLSGAALLFLTYQSNGISLGASAGVMSIVVATAIFMPNYYVNLFILGPVKIKWIAIFMFITSTLLDISNNTGGKIAHMGGALFGLLFALYLKNKYNIASPIFLGKNQYVTRSNDTPKQSIDDRDRTNKVNKSKEIDKLLDKISKSGYNSLSNSEKENLKLLSKK